MSDNAHFKQPAEETEELLKEEMNETLEQPIEVKGDLSLLQSEDLKPRSKQKLLRKQDLGDFKKQALKAGGWDDSDSEKDE